MDRIPLYEEYRLIERSDSEINGAWKGAHLLLFFLAFVFGSFCTFCFHILMHLFDEKCVLFPKLLSLTEQRHSIIYDFIPDKKAADAMPVDFVSTQWVESSVCYMPMYVPLLSGICGLIWTAMVLMCSSANQTLTGLQRSWRILPPIFIFSLAMGGLCIYSSVITQSGLMDLCLILSEVTGSTTCSYTVNVATLAYERRIRGVYQAIRMTILSAWLHTCCWLLAAVLVLLRILLVVDFRLVRVQAELQGDIDRILEHHEKHIRTVSPEVWIKDDGTNTRTNALEPSSDSIKIHFRNEAFNVPFQSVPMKDDEDFIVKSISTPTLQQFALPRPTRHSRLSLVPDELHKLGRLSAYYSVEKNMRFIVKMIYDMLDSILDSKGIPDESKLILHESSSAETPPSSGADNEDSDFILERHVGQRRIVSKSAVPSQADKDAEQVESEITHEILNSLIKRLDDTRAPSTSTPSSSPPHLKTTIPRKKLFASSMNITREMKRKILLKKSNLKNKKTQTDAERKREFSPQKVQIAESALRIVTDSEVTLKPIADSVEEIKKDQDQKRKEDQESKSQDNERKEDRDQEIKEDQSPKKDDDTLIPKKEKQD